MLRPPLQRLRCRSFVGLLASGGLLALALPLLTTEAGRAQQAEPQVRVLLLESNDLIVSGLSGGLRLRDARGTVLAEAPGGQNLELRLAGGLVEALGLPRPLRLNELWIEPLADGGADGGLGLLNRRYRGRLQLLPGSSSLRVINHLSIETYLPSVVGSEMPASWPLEALRAQAVAARTYALQQRKPAAPFDLRATVASQAYRGVEAETPSTWEAVRATRALVLTYQGDLINAVFHSSSGGSTENSGDLWARQLPYLVSVPDFDDQSPVREWRQVLQADVLQRAFAEIGGASRIEVLATTSTGRVRQVRVVGPRGQLLLNGAELRSRLALKSTLVRFEPLAPGAAFAVGQSQPFGQAESSGPDQSFGRPPSSFRPSPWLRDSPPVDSATGVPLPDLPPLPPGPRFESQPAAGLVAIGRGFGHGVGMSQWGAYGMARRGEGFEGILRHFYRGAVVGPFRDLTAQAPVTLLPSGPLAGRADPLFRATAPLRIPTVLANRERP